MAKQLTPEERVDLEKRIAAKALEIRRMPLFRDAALHEAAEEGGYTIVTDEYIETNSDGTQFVSQASESQQNSESVIFYAEKGDWANIHKIVVRPPITQPPDGSHTPPPYPPKDTGKLALMGLHTSADDTISDEEFLLFNSLRPPLIKVLSNLNKGHLATLAREHPKATFIIRAFVSIHNRVVTSREFFNWTINDVRDCIKAIGPNRIKIIELHNEPNLVQEGAKWSWCDWNQWERWAFALLQDYRAALPGFPFMYPGLSPGNEIEGVRQHAMHYLQRNSRLINEMAHLGIHLYWNPDGPGTKEPLAYLDKVIQMYPNKPIWVTEASIPYDMDNEARARAYIGFWHELQLRKSVKGITYFCASASNRDFRHETWVGKGLVRYMKKIYGGTLPWA